MKQLTFVLILLLNLIIDTNIVWAEEAPITNSTNLDIKLNKPILEDNLTLIGTGTISGVYYPTGNGICRLINKERKFLGTRCAVESTAGSITNIDALRVAEMDFALVQSDWQEHAYNGTGVFVSKDRFDKLRFVLSLYSEAITIIVTKSSKIIKVDDLKGHIINVGPNGSGVKATIEDIMKAKGWTKEDFKGLSDVSPYEQPKALCNGSVDALILATGHPNELVEQVAKTCEIRILNVDDPVIKKFIAGNPEFAPTIIPAGLYTGVTKNVNTFGVKATFVTTSEISDQTVYNITKTIFENLDAFKKFHPVLNNLDETEMANTGRTAPYHNGALKYYQEKGLVK